MAILENCKPKEVFKYFEEICGIPHGSTNMEDISNYLVNFAKERNLKYRQDEMLNVIIWKDGILGGENKPAVIIQGHMDMVAVKTLESNKNMEKEGLDLEIINDDFISAKNTSLGADDGIAVAYALALLDTKIIPHPPLEVVITVDEEIGLLGATAIDLSDLKGRTLLNIDSEDEGRFTVSCAGGMTNICKLPYRACPTMKKSKEIENAKEIEYTKEIEKSKEFHMDMEFVEIELSGFLGGHSGSDINKGRLNSNIVMGRILYAIKELAIRLVNISGGEKDNAIAKISRVSFVAAKSKLPEIIDIINKCFENIKAEYANIEKNIKLKLEHREYENMLCLNLSDTEKIINFLMAIPNGVIRMNPEIPDMVQSSLNIGVIETRENEIVITASVRSSVETEKKYISDKIRALVNMAGGQLEICGDYPGWAYKKDSKIREKMILAYKEIYHTEPIIESIHAGLECGLFSSKISNLDCISFGPQMYNIHTTDEVLSISSTERSWELIKKLLEKLLDE